MIFDIFVRRAIIGSYTNKGAPATYMAGYCEYGPDRGVCTSIPDTPWKD